MRKASSRNLTRVYVDAKIVGRHLPHAEYKTFVAFIAEGRPDLNGFKEVEAEETDRAEEEAMLNAIQKLTRFPHNLKRFVIICDHESAVLKANWKGAQRKGNGDETLEKLWEELDLNPGVEVDPLTANPAHRFLNLKLKEMADLEKQSNDR